MKKQLNIEEFKINEVRLVETKTKKEDGTFDSGWDALVQYTAVDADGDAQYSKVLRLTLAPNLSNQLVNSFSTAIDTFETSPKAPK